MSKVDILYHNLARGIIEQGYDYSTDNRDVTCKQITSANLEIPLTEEFPLITTKKMFTKGIVEELLWFLRGQDNIKSLINADVHIWDKDAYNWYTKKYKEAYPNSPQNMFTFQEWLSSPDTTQVPDYKFGDVGRTYGTHWRGFTGVEMIDSHQEEVVFLDQISKLLKNLRKDNPISRRHIISAWNPAELQDTPLPACHWAFEVLPRPLSYSQKIELSGGDKVYLDGLWSAMIKNDQEAKELLDKELAHVPNYGFTLKWHQRSVDTFLGLPFNITSYALLAHIIGSITDMIPLSIIGDLSNVHFYSPHIPMVKEQLERNPAAVKGPKLRFSQNYLDWLQAYKDTKEWENGKYFSFDNFLENISSEDFIFEDYQSLGPLKAEMYEPTK